jgi:hypothetical protein
VAFGSRIYRSMENVLAGEIGIDRMERNEQWWDLHGVIG